jgi:hypothetical protein
MSEVLVSTMVTSTMVTSSQLTWLTQSEAVTGGSFTVAEALPVTPSVIAEMVADPGATAVTSPISSTVAIEVALLDHVKVRLDIAAPLEFRASAVKVAVSPGKSNGTVLGVMATVATEVPGSTTSPPSQASTARQAVGIARLKPRKSWVFISAFSFSALIRRCGEWHSKSPGAPAERPAHYSA